MTLGGNCLICGVGWVYYEPFLFNDEAICENCWKWALTLGQMYEAKRKHQEVMDICLAMQ